MTKTPIKIGITRKVSAPVQAALATNENTTAPQLKALESLVTSARAVANDHMRRLQGAYMGKTVKSWDEVHKMFPDIIIPQHVMSAPFNLLNYTMFNRGYVNEYVNGTIKAALANANVEKQKIDYKNLSNRVVALANGQKLYPQQQKAVNQFLDLVWPTTSEYTGGVLPLPTGEGKSYIVAAIVRWLQLNNQLKRSTAMGIRPFGRVLVLTKKPVVIKTRVKCRELGVEDINKDVFVMHYEALSAAKYAMFFGEEEVELFGNTVKMPVFMAGCIPPDLVILDECQVAKKPKSTKSKKLLAIYKAGFGNTKWLCTSATAGVTLSDMYLAAITSGIKYQGQRVTTESFVPFIKTFTKNPDALNTTAMTKFRNYLGPALIQPPADPRNYKIFNSILLMDFKNDEQRKHYFSAERRWVEAQERIGKGVSEKGLAAAMFTVLRQTAEQCLVDNFCDIIESELAKGRVVAVAVNYQQTIRDMKVALVRRKIVPEDQITITWGGDAEIRPDQTIQDIAQYNKMLNDYAGALSKAQASAATEEPRTWKEIVMEHCGWTKKDITKWNKTSKFIRERSLRNETAAQQADRVQMQRDMGLYKQSDEQRETDIQKYLRGGSKVHLFTLPAGGTGLDLDHQYPTSWPRTLLAMPCFYGEEFVQGFGRCARKGTLSDVYNYMVCFSNTIISEHVVPVLENKIANINALSATGIDVENMLATCVSKGKITLAEVDRLCAKAAVAKTATVEVGKSEQTETVVEEDDSEEEDDGEED